MATLKASVKASVLTEAKDGVRTTILPFSGRVGDKYPKSPLTAEAVGKLDAAGLKSLFYASGSTTQIHSQYEFMGTREYTYPASAGKAKAGQSIEVPIYQPAEDADLIEIESAADAPIGGAPTE